METMRSDEKFSTGDRVRHAARPEWGIGTVIKVEAANGAATNGHTPQRVSVRFPNAGTKTLIASRAELVRVETNAEPFLTGESPVSEYWNKMSESDWLAPMAKRKVEQAMISLPPDVRDPFNSLQKRLSLTMALYRFDRSGRGLMNWAVAQTGLDDPLSKFTRHELEEKFDRWAYERDSHLTKLIQEARAPGSEPGVVNAALKSAPPAAQDTVRRLIMGR